MGPLIPSRDLEACRMSNEVLPDEEVAARVRVAVFVDFQLEHVNGFLMKPKKGYYDLVSPLSHCYLPPFFDSIFLRFVFVLPGGD